MMSRVSMGHTGRMIVVPRSVAFAFGLLSAAAMTRAIGPLVLPAHYFAELVVSAGLWSIAFAIFVAVYLPILGSARVDGKPG
jgi:uncharacterized protein involved in response to NO